MPREKLSLEPTLNYLQLNFWKGTSVRLKPTANYFFSLKTYYKMLTVQYATLFRLQYENE